jgi:hypothetical protein
MKRWTIPLVLGAVALVALAAAFGVSRATAATMHRTASGSQSGSGGCARLMSDPAASQAMQPLHDEHVKDMQAWRAQYGKNPQSAVAQAALATLRRQHLGEMRAALEKLGIKVPAGACDGGMMDGTDGAGMMGGDAGGMMGGSGAGGSLHEQHHGAGGSNSSGASGGMMDGTSGMMGGAATY